MRGAYALVASVILLCAGGGQRAESNEESNRLVAEASRLIRATPPQSLEAMETLRRATAADPNDARAWFVRGGYALTLALTKDAIESLDKAAALNPNLPNLQYFRGRALHDRGRHVEALSAYDREPNKANPTYWFHRGLAAKAARDYRRALADFDESDKVYEAGRPATQLHRGDIYAAQRKLAEAESAYRQVAALDPNSPVAKTAQERLRIVRTAASAPARRPAAARTAGTSAPAAPQPAPKNLSVRTFLGGEYDSNVALLDAGIPFPAQLKRKHDLRLVSETTATYFLINEPLAYVGILGNVRASFHDRNDNYDDALFGASMFAAKTIDKWRVGGELRGDRTRVDYMGYAWATSATAWTAHRWTGLHETLFTYRFRDQDFDTEPLDQRFDRDGATHYISLSHLWRLYQAGKDYFDIEPGLRFGWERTNGRYFDNDEWAAFLTLRAQKQIFRYPTLLELVLFYYQQDFTDALTQLAINVQAQRVRQDENFSQRLRLQQPLGDNWGIEASYRHARNNSNVYSFSHQSHVVRLGLLAWY